MNVTWDEPWSSNPNAPQIPYQLYFSEKAYLSGSFLSSIFYGIVITLFFQCMGALFDPVNRTSGGAKWPLVAHTAAMFSFVTIYTSMYLNLQSISFIDNREYSGANGGLPPGPLGYQHLIYNKAISIVPHGMFMLNTWLADGLLLYRCYVIYAMNYWVIAFPCLMYLASFVMGVVLIYYQVTQPTTALWGSVPQSFDYPFFAISPSLNIILTLMIVVRLVVHQGRIRNAMGPSATTSKWYMAVVTILVESCALYAVSFILFLGPWGASSSAANIFFPVVAQTQVIAPLLIIQRVANRKALTSESLASGAIDSIRFKSRGDSTGGTGSLPGGYAIGSKGVYGKSPSDLSGGIDIETTIELHHGNAY